MSIIATVDDLVEALGGTKAVADWALVSPSAVSHWRSERKIPRGWHLELYAECLRREIQIDTVSVFGMKLPLPAVAPPMSEGASA
jgi:hypothetical protein